jgi:hypothetical protein
MGACYNTILMPAIYEAAIVAAICDALQSLGCRIVDEERMTGDQHGFRNGSTLSVFVGPTDGSPWVPIASWGDGLRCPFPGWYRDNPLAAALSRGSSPIVYLFTYNAGLTAGYSIFENGRQTAGQTLNSKSEWPLNEFSPPADVPSGNERLTQIMADPGFDFESFMRRFRYLEEAIAGLAARLGASVHLIDALDVQDGDGAIVVVDGEYRQVATVDWIGIFYEKDPSNGSE